MSHKLKTLTLPIAAMVRLITAQWSDETDLRKERKDMLIHWIDTSGVQIIITAAQWVGNSKKQ